MSTCAWCEQPIPGIGTSHGICTRCRGKMRKDSMKPVELSFSIGGNVEEKAKEGMRRAESELVIHFVGDTKSGSFHGKGTSGSYSIEGNTLKIRIEEKPFFVPIALIKSKLEGFFR